MPPTARWPFSWTIPRASAPFRTALRLRPPDRAARSPRCTHRAQQVLNGAQLHSLHRRRRAFFVRDLGAEAGLVDDDAAEFVLDDDGVAGVRPFRLEQRHFGGCIHGFSVLYLPLGHFAFEMRAANSDGGDGYGDPHVLPLVARNEPAHVSKRPLQDPGGKGLLAGNAACRLEILLHFEFRIRPEGKTRLVCKVDLQDCPGAGAYALSCKEGISLRQLAHGAARRLRAAQLVARDPRRAPDGGGLGLRGRRREQQSDEAYADRVEFHFASP